MMSGDANNNDFQDPLENYEPPTFDDPIEQALHESAVTAIQAQPFTAMPANTTVRDTIARLAGEDIACVMLTDDDGKLVGVFSDRNVLDRVALEFDEIADEPVRTVMTTDPIYVQETDCAAAALAVMAVSGYRHVPIVDHHHKPVGIVSPHRMTGFLTQKP